MQQVPYEEYAKLKEQYEEAVTRLDILLNNIPGGVFSYDVETGKFDFIGKGLLALFHCDEETFKEHFYNSFDLMVFKADRKMIKEQIGTQMEFFHSVEVTYRVQDFMNDHQFIWLLHKAHLVKHKDGREFFFVVVSDVTERRLVQSEMQHVNEKLYIETERYKLIEEAIEEIQFDYDVQADRATFSMKDENGNRKAVEQFMKQNVIRQSVHPEDYDVANSHLIKALLVPVKDVLEYRSRLLNHEYIWFRMNYASFADENGVVIRVVGILKDITEERAAKEVMKQKIRTDQMTGILNKVSTQNAIEDYLQECKPLAGAGMKNGVPTQALLAIDTDNFKNVNDTLGHMYGDDVIKFVAKTLSNTFKENDIVGRTGGDEFMVLMKNATPEVVEERAGALNKVMNRDFAKDGKKVHISCSIGIAYYSAQTSDYESLFACADAALYQAKEAGKNCFRVYVET